MAIIAAELIVHQWTNVFKQTMFPTDIFIDGKKLDHMVKFQSPVVKASG